MIAFYEVYLHVKCVYDIEKRWLDLVNVFRKLDIWFSGLTFVF